MILFKTLSLSSYWIIPLSDLHRATGVDAHGDSKRLNRVLQLTGFSDSVYAEAYITVHQYDVVMDVTVVNRSAETLQNLCLELATMGDLKLVERPQNYTLSPGDCKVIRANIKVGRGTISAREGAC